MNPSMFPTHGDSKPRNTSAWTLEEDQILFDGLLIGNILHLWHRFDKDFGRTVEDVNSRAQYLTPNVLPRYWRLSREEAYKEVRKLTDEGEPELSQSEWKELVLWIHNDYVGIDPSVFDWRLSTERLRQELRIFDDMPFSIFDRITKMFAAEKASNPGKFSTEGKRYKPTGRQSAEAKECRVKRDAEVKPQGEKAKTEIKEDGGKKKGGKNQSKSKQGKTGQSSRGRQLPTIEEMMIESDRKMNDAAKEGTVHTKVAHRLSTRPGLTTPASLPIISNSGATVVRHS